MNDSGLEIETERLPRQSGETNQNNDDIRSFFHLLSNHLCVIVIEIGTAHFPERPKRATAHVRFTPRTGRSNDRFRGIMKFRY